MIARTSIDNLLSMSTEDLADRRQRIVGELEEIHRLLFCMGKAPQTTRSMRQTAKLDLALNRELDLIDRELRARREK